jgi:outer membrane protein
MEEIMRKLVLAVVVGIFVVCGTISMASAQSAPKIGIVDVLKAMNESERGKRATAELESLIKSKQAAIDSKGRALERLKSELERQGDVLSADARRSKTEEYERLARELKRNADDSRNEIGKKQTELEGRILQSISNIVEAIGQEEKYTIIHERRAVLYYEPGLDITATVIRRLDSGASSSSAKPKKTKK